MLSVCRTRVGINAVALATALGVMCPGLASADSGYATWYGPGFQGNTMYNGQVYNMYDPTTTACNIYPLGTWIRVTNPANGRSVIVQVRDRGAFSHAFDLSYAAFKSIANPAVMGIPVTYQVVSGPSGAPVVARATPSSRGARPAPSGRYVVQPGDTLDGIAAHVGIDASKLVAWNSLENPDKVTVGQVLSLTAPGAPATAAASAASDRSYVVQPGDTLLGIAEKFDVSSAQLVSANELSDPNDIVIGQKLVIPGSKSAASAPKIYTVQPGDSLSAIADSYGISISSLISANRIDDPSVIQPGTHLAIPSA